MAFIRSISGLRATLGDDLHPEIITQYTKAFAAICSEGAIAVGRDGRPSGEWIEKIVCETLLLAGKNVVRLGVVPTPTVQLFAERNGFAGGISITASHNPSQWNGLKFINERGIFLNAAENKELWECVDNQDFTPKTQPIDAPKFESAVAMALQQHINSIIKGRLFAAFDNENFGLVTSKKFTVVVDAVNASGSLVVPALCKQLGCEVIELYCDGSGNFPHTPEPLPAHLGDLCEAVKLHKADVGIAVDPDADRLVLIDDQGKPIGEENTIVLATMAVLANKHLFENQALNVVVNLSTTKAVEDVARHFGATLHRTPVGEINVAEKMLEVGAQIGGEGSGGVIMPICHAGRDSLVGISLILLLLAQTDQPLSFITANLPKYSMVKLKKDISGAPYDILREIAEKYASKATVNLDDGLRIDFISSWVHLRASNTEPIIRVIAEAPTLEDAEALAHEFMEMLQ